MLLLKKLLQIWHDLDLDYGVEKLDAICKNVIWPARDLIKECETHDIAISKFENMSHEEFIDWLRNYKNQLNNKED